MNNSDQLKIALEKKIKSFSRKGNMSKIAKEAAKIVKKRTRTAGKDARDITFKKLAKSTAMAKWRKAGGRPRKGSRVPEKYYRSILTETKAMLNALAGKGIKDNVGIVYFKDDYQIKKASWNEKLGRTFFGFSPKDETKLSNFIRKLLRKERGL